MQGIITIITFFCAVALGFDVAFRVYFKKNIKLLKISIAVALFILICSVITGGSEPVPLDIAASIENIIDNWNRLFVVYPLIGSLMFLMVSFLLWLVKPAFEDFKVQIVPKKITCLLLLLALFGVVFPFYQKNHVYVYSKTLSTVITKNDVKYTGYIKKTPSNYEVKIKTAKGIITVIPMHNVKDIKED